MCRSASNSNLVNAANPVLIRYRSFFGSDNNDGNGNSEYATRVGVVCGAGLFKNIQSCLDVREYIQRGECLRTSPSNSYKRGAIPSLGGK